MSFRSMSEFRRALARQNMGMTLRTEDGGEITFDSVEELMAYQEAMGGRKRRKRSDRKSKVGSLGRSSSRKSKAKPRKPRSVPADNANRPPTNRQAGPIIASVGGLEEICPWVLAEEGFVSAGQALFDLGLTRGTASAVIGALKDAGVYGRNSAGSSKAKKAKAIVAKVGGVTCAVPNPAFASSSAWPEYSYKQFWRQNPRREGYNRAWWPEPDAESGFVPDYAPMNAGPYLPGMYPYGQGGRAGAYKNPKATKSRRRSAARKGLTLSGGTAWPVYDREHALLALQYMSFGAGGKKWQRQYPKMVRKLAAIYSPESDRNREIWSYYRKARTKISGVSGKKMPTMRELRRIEPRRAAANPRGLSDRQPFDPKADEWPALELIRQKSDPQRQLDHDRDEVDLDLFWDDREEGYILMVGGTGKGFGDTQELFSSKRKAVRAANDAYSELVASGFRVYSARSNPTRFRPRQPRRMERGFDDIDE